MRIRRVGIVGAGAMGAAIAELFAFNEIEARLCDLTPERVERGLASVGRVVEELVDYEARRAPKEIERLQALGVTLTEAQRSALVTGLTPKVSAQRGREIVGRVRGVNGISELDGVDLAIEAVFEKFEAKRPVLEALDRLLPPEAVIATNTSSLSITELGAGLPHRERLLAMHFFNPPSTLPLVEVAGGLDTREGLVEEAVEFLQGLRNHRYPLAPIRVREGPGFVVNRLLIPVLNEACFALDEGLASSREIDLAMKAGAGMPMGPFELADLIGLDVALEVAETLVRETGDPKYRPSPSLRRRVAAGHLGRKTGRGFYEYV